MKRFILAIIIMIAWIAPLSAETYDSPFGFSIILPSHWLVLSKQELKDNPDLFNIEREEFKDFNKEFLSQLKNHVASGQVEFYINKKTSNFYYADNINVFKGIDRLPKTISELKQYCAKMPQVASEVYGKPIKYYNCEFKKVAGLDSIFVITDGPIDGTRCAQYLIQKSPSIVIVITAASRDETFEIIKKEFEEIMVSFKIH